MKVIVENTPKKSRLSTSFVEILRTFTEDGIDPEYARGYVESSTNGEFFVYRGGSHIAIHERNVLGKPMEERLILIELN